MADPGFFLGGEGAKLKKNWKRQCAFFIPKLEEVVCVFFNYKRENGSIFIPLKKTTKY